MIEMPGIPKKIHQMWLDKFVRNNTEYPEKYRNLGYPKSWTDLNPDYEYTLWNWDKVHELFESPELARWRDFYYKRLEHHIEKCDFARYAILYKHGGFSEGFLFSQVKVSMQTWTLSV